MVTSAKGIGDEDCPSETVTVRSTFFDTNGCSFSRQERARKMVAKATKINKRDLIKPSDYLLKHYLK